jgi:prophage antirepressor-like protein
MSENKAEQKVNIELFRFDGRRVRVAIVDNKPIWVAKDVCRTLGLTDTSKACEQLEDGTEKGTTIIRTPGGPQKVLGLHEPGLYRLVFKSTKPEAERVKHWLAHEVLPALRQKGYYVMGEKPGDNQEAILEQLLATVRRQKVLEADTEAIRQSIDSEKQEREKLEAKIEAADARITAIAKTVETRPMVQQRLHLPSKVGSLGARRIGEKLAEFAIDCAATIARENWESPLWLARMLWCESCARRITFTKVLHGEKAAYDMTADQERQVYEMLNVNLKRQIAGMCSGKVPETYMRRTQKSESLFARRRLVRFHNARKANGTPPSTFTLRAVQ